MGKWVIIMVLGLSLVDYVMVVFDFFVLRIMLNVNVVIGVGMMVLVGNDVLILE